MNPSTATAPIRIFLVDDHPMIRCGLAAMIDGEDDFALVGEAASGDEAVARIPLACPASWSCSWAGPCAGAN